MADVKIVVRLPEDVYNSLTQWAVPEFDDVPAYLRSFIFRAWRAAKDHPLGLSAIPLVPGGPYTGTVTPVLAAAPAAAPAPLPPTAASSNVIPLPTSATSDAASRSTRRTASGYRGVYRYGDRWEAVIRIDGQRHRVGICDTPEEAAVIYDEHAKARNRPLNFPPPARPDPVEPYMQKLIRGETFTTEEFNAFAQASILSDWVAAGNPPETCPKYAPPPAIALGGPRPLRYAPEPQPPPEYHEDEDPQPPLDEDPSYEPPPLLPVAPEIAATLPNISVVNMFGLADEQG